jgi:hypothetical protein
MFRNGFARIDVYKDQSNKGKNLTSTVVHGATVWSESAEKASKMWEASIKKGFVNFKRQYLVSTLVVGTFSFTYRLAFHPDRRVDRGIFPHRISVSPLLRETISLTNGRLDIK